MRGVEGGGEVVGGGGEGVGRGKESKKGNGNNRVMIQRQLKYSFISV